MEHEHALDHDPDYEVDLPTTTAEITAFVRRVKAETDGHSHSDDPAMAREHEAVMGLVTRSEATHVAIAHGDWTDPATWWQGRVPGADAKVLIPRGVHVTYDSVSGASVDTVRVDGLLDFATRADTRLVVDTLVVSPTGKLEIGTAADPVRAGVSAEIVIANNGAIDVSWDPLLFSRGVVSHGAVEIHGAEKDAFLKVAYAPLAGDRTIQLSETPDGWGVGDTIVLTGTHKTGWAWNNAAGRQVHVASQDEEVRIVAIDGNRITLDRALAYDHDAPRADLAAYVANMSRSVTIRSEDGAATPVSQRGHVMLMHSDDVDVRYAAFDDLGRTDKSRPAWDATALANVTATSNVKGRYSLHLHKTGLDDMSDPAMVVGNAVSGSPGWGYAHHSSNAVFADNAAFDVFGAAYAAEDGDEVGSWTHNIAIRSVGIGYGEWSVKDEADLPRHDNGRTGDGFFFAGRLVDARDNVAANTTHGYVWMHRSAPKNPDADTVDHPEIGYGRTTIRLDQAPIQGFHDNEAFGTAVGLIVVKADARQEHDVRTIMDGFLNWETSSGMDITYTSHYTIKNVDVVATDGDAFSSAYSVLPSAFGFRFGGNAYDIVVNGMKIDGFNIGVDFTANNFSLPVVASDVGHVLIDVAMTGVRQAYLGYDATRHRIMSSDDLVVGRLDFNMTGDRTISWDETLYFNGTKTDSIGSRNRQFVSVDDLQQAWFSRSLAPLLQTDGYWTTGDGRRVMLVEDFIADRATGELEKLAHVITLDLSTAQLNALGAVNRGAIALGGQAPIGGADRVSTAMNEMVLIDVLANDRDPEGGRIRVDGMTQPRFGDVLLAEDGRSILYMPGVNVTGTDSFTYWVADNSGNFTPTRVTVDLTGGGETGLTLHGSAGDDRIAGKAGDDFIHGYGGDDRLRGGKGDDVIRGGQGADLLQGGGGDDSLQGGRGADRFDMRGGGSDVILDFQQGVDRIVFSNNGVDSTADLTVTRSGSDTLISYGNGSVLVLDTLPGAFSTEDFVF